jgi:predicted MFS family arabinose efflux permease
MARNRPMNHAAVSGPENPVAGTLKSTAPRSLKARLPIIFVVRTTVNTAVRLIYPFLPSIARGLGVSLAAASRLVTLRMVGGMAAPLLGKLADRYGRRRVMEVALALFALAGLLMAGLGTLAAAAVAFTLYGFAKALYDPAVHAYVGDEVPYEERGRAIGIVELSWSSAWLLGVPASGVLIERFGWRAPWAALIVLGLVGLGFTRAILPPAHPAAGRERAGSLLASMVGTWRDLLRRRSVLVLLATSFLFTSAIEIPFIVYGAWLETSFGLSLSTLGLASTVVGVAEAAAEFGTAVIADRLGKKRSVLVGLLGLAASLVALPWLSRLGLAAALAGVMLMLLNFEFGIVSLMPLATELAPEARASLFSLAVTAFSLSRVLAALVGGWLWQWHSIALNAGVGALCALVGALLLVWGMTEVAQSTRGSKE